MAVKVAVPKETRPGERRVALAPAALRQFEKLGVELLLQKGAGLESGFDDADYKNVKIVDSEEELLGQADVVMKVQPPTEKEVGMMREGAVLLGYLAPHEGDSRIKALCKRNVTSLSMELVPRISRAQAIDALSSQGAISGYKAVLIAAERSPRFFPMLTPRPAPSVRPRCW